MQSIQEVIKDDRFLQFVRFCVVGTIAAAVHYGVYFLLQLWVDVNIAYTTGYLVSFVGNFYLTNYFTFRTIPSLRRFLGFAGSHAFNYFLHIVLFNCFLALGVHRLVAPPLVMLVAMLAQFMVLRFVFTVKGKGQDSQFVDEAE